MFFEKKVCRFCIGGHFQVSRIIVYLLFSFWAFLEVELLSLKF